MKASDLIKYLQETQDKIGDFGVGLVLDDNYHEIGFNDIKIMQTNNPKAGSLSLCVELTIYNEIITAGI